MINTPDVELGRLDQELKTCRLCLDAGFQITPGAIFSHPPPAEVMLIGQAPGITEVEAKRPFNAGSGRRLFQWLARAGWSEEDFRSRYVMTAVTKCYPGKAGNGKGDRLPGKTEQRLCRPYLERELSIFRPRLVIPVGGLAIDLFFPASLRLDQTIGTAGYLSPQAASDPLNLDLSRVQLLSDFDGESPGEGCWVVPLPHPSGASLWPNRPENQALIQKAVDLLAQIRAAWNL